MKIGIESLDVVYHYLGHRYDAKHAASPLRNQDSKEIFPFDYNQSVMVFPFENVQVRFARFGGKYSGEVLLKSENDNPFVTCYKSFDQKIENMGDGEYEFRHRNMKTKDYRGFIFDRKGRKVLSITDSDDVYGRVIAIGTRGADDQMFPESEADFINQVGLLERVTNNVIQTVLSAYLDRREAALFADETISVQPA